LKARSFVGCALGVSVAACWPDIERKGAEPPADGATGSGGHGGTSISVGDAMGIEDGRGSFFVP
jgi:hypothetical protein